MFSVTLLWFITPSKYPIHGHLRIDGLFHAASFPARAKKDLMARPPSGCAAWSQSCIAYRQSSILCLTLSSLYNYLSETSLTASITGQTILQYRHRVSCGAKASGTGSRISWTRSLVHDCRRSRDSMLGACSESSERVIFRLHLSLSWLDLCVGRLYIGACTCVCSRVFAIDRTQARWGPRKFNVHEPLRDTQPLAIYRLPTGRFCSLCSIVLIGQPHYLRPAYEYASVFLCYFFYTHCTHKPELKLSVARACPGSCLAFVFLPHPVSCLGFLFLLHVVFRGLMYSEDTASRCVASVRPVPCPLSPVLSNESVVFALFTVVFPIHAVVPPGRGLP